MFIEIKTINNQAAFNFTIEGFAINGKEIFLTINTIKIICLTCLYPNKFGIGKYGNHQDFPFAYDEVNVYMKRGKRIDKLRQFIEIRDIKQPILVKHDVKSLEESAHEYMDYETFVLNNDWLSL